MAATCHIGPRPPAGDPPCRRRGSSLHGGAHGAAHAPPPGRSSGVGPGSGIARASVAGHGVEWPRATAGTETFQTARRSGPDFTHAGHPWRQRQHPEPVQIPELAANCFQTEPYIRLRAGIDLMFSGLPNYGTVPWPFVRMHGRCSSRLNVENFLPRRVTNTACSTHVGSGFNILIFLRRVRFVPSSRSYWGKAATWMG